MHRIPSLEVFRIESRNSTTKSKPFPNPLLSGVSARVILCKLAAFTARLESIGSPRYAQPATGGQKVRHHNFNHDVQDAVEEVKYLCSVIRQCGHKNLVDGSIQITFGELFDVSSLPMRIFFLMPHPHRRSMWIFPVNWSERYFAHGNTIISHSKVNCYSSIEMKGWLSPCWKMTDVFY